MLESLRLQEKLRLSLFIMLFIINVCIANLFKKSINEVDRYTLDTQIKGVGKIKADRIVTERELHGNYKNKYDFEERTKNFIGEKVVNRIEKTYKIK